MKKEIRKESFEPDVARHFEHINRELYIRNALTELQAAISNLTENLGGDYPMTADQKGIIRLAMAGRMRMTAEEMVMFYTSGQMDDFEVARGEIKFIASLTD